MLTSLIIAYFSYKIEVKKPIVEVIAKKRVETNASNFAEYTSSVTRVNKETLRAMFIKELININKS